MSDQVWWSRGGSEEEEEEEEEEVEMEEGCTRVPGLTLELCS